MTLARFFKRMQDRRSARSERWRRAFDALGLAADRDARRLQSELDLLIGRTARLREELRDQ